ncbi:HCNGP family protein [Besnoitia besnoiti]|uniref:HCNGP family protein n=1 Tax=Besnoitia besnoiti TaxID=94643 RepID=A0A2A9MNG0_BESBE|nr:HCNGP family protein [Besnoitia besnoiti]PFH37433.1 HCNGP family protein [Besnoitia besnoiti]
MSLVDYGFYSDEEEDEAGDVKELAGATEAGASPGILAEGEDAIGTMGTRPREALSSVVAVSGELSEGPGAPGDLPGDESGKKHLEEPGSEPGGSESGEREQGGRTRRPEADVTPSEGRELLDPDGSAEGGDQPSSSHDQGHRRTTAGARQAHQRQIYANGRPPTEGHVSLMPQVPAGEVPQELLRTVERLQQLKRRGITVNGNIAASLDFKNPYLLEKIMKVFAIDPYCSNYPPSVFDPGSVTPWECDGGVSFAVHLMRRFESRRQLARRTESHSGRELERTTPPLSSSAVPSVPLASSTSASTASGALVASSSASSSSEFLHGTANGSIRQSQTRSRFERISPPASQLAEQTSTQLASAAAASASMAAASQLSAVIQQAALKAAAAQAGAVASAVQQQLQQRLLAGQSGFSQQKSSLLEASAAAAAASAASRSHARVQQDGAGGVGVNSFNHRPMLRVPSPSGAGSHPTAELSRAVRGGNDADSTSKKRARDGAGTPAGGSHQTDSSQRGRSGESGTKLSTATTRWGDAPDDWGKRGGSSSSALRK